jgi:hypothetical protein
MTPIIRRFVIKMLAKDQGSGITKLPNQMQVGFQESITTEKLVRNGYDPRAIKDETELKVILNRIDATAKQTREQKEKAMKQLADIMDMKGRKIPPGSKIMGGEEVVETEAEILERMNRENKEGIEGLKQKMAKEKSRTQKISGNLRAENAQRYDIGEPKLDEDEYDYYREILGEDAEYDYYPVKGDETKEMLEAMVKEQQDEMAYMKRLYDKGALDPTPEELRRLKDAETKEVDETKDILRKLTDEDPEDMAQGGRAGLAAGGMGRRAFLKLMAAGGAGIAGLKSGLINIFKPRSQAVQEVVETVAKSDATGMPEHFMPLVNKIMNEGKLVKESDRIQTYKHPTRTDLELEYELDSGSVGVRFETDEGMPADYYLRKAVPDEGNPRGTGDEFFEGEMVYRPDAGGSYSKDFEEYISSGTTNLDEFTGVKVKDANKSKLPIDVADPDEFASGGIARMLGE